MNHAFIIGAQRSGTTLLYSILEKHDEICMALPMRPEPKFFMSSDDEGDTEKSYLSSFFDHHSTEKILIEKSTSYYERAEVANRIKAFSSEAKIIFLARNPVHRAISNYYFSKLHNIEKRTIEEVFLYEKAPPTFSFNTSVDPFNYLGRGKYLQLLEPYVQTFGLENIHIMAFEQLVLGNGLQSLSSFLGVHEFTNSTPPKKINASGKSDAQIPTAVLEKLNDFYLPYNSEFAQTLNFDLKLWKD